MKKGVEYHFRVSDAQAYGSADIAAILYNLRFWLRHNLANERHLDPRDRYHIRDGRVWTFNTLQAWSELFPWLSQPQIKRLLKKLEDNGILLKSRSYNSKKYDRTTWYSLDEPEFIVGRPKEEAKNGEKCSTDHEYQEGTKSSHGKDGIVPSSTDIKQQIKNTTTTELPPVDKIYFEDFGLALISTLNEMLLEDGWLPEGSAQPKASWLKSKARELYDRLPDPSPADCAVLILSDWSRLTRQPTTKKRF